jgi:hypothetical protein
LEAISNRGPHRRGELFTFEGMAHGRLLEVRAVRQLHTITAGAQTDTDRTAAIVAFIGKDQASAALKPTNANTYALRKLLYGELEKSDSPEAARLLFASGQFKRDYAEKHHKEMLAYARSLSGEQALANSPLVEALGRSGDKDVIPLFQKWLLDTPDERTGHYIEARLKQLGGIP